MVQIITTTTIETIIMVMVQVTITATIEAITMVMVQIIITITIQIIIAIMSISRMVNVIVIIVIKNMYFKKNYSNLNSFFSCFK